MIGRLTGNVLECSPNQLLLDVGGVGYALQIPLSTYYTLVSDGGRGRCSVHVHTHVREDALQLYGFAEEDERAAFEQLIGISGVGPRLALAVLSGIGVAELRQAVHRQDHGRLQKIPGVGKKTAERVVLELRDKMGRAAAEAQAPAPAAEQGPEEGTRADALSALVNLGYTRDRAAGAVDQSLEALGPEPPLEALLRAALGRLVR